MTMLSEERQKMHNITPCGNFLDRMKYAQLYGNCTSQVSIDIRNQ